MTEQTKPKDPMSYTDKELEIMRIDKKSVVQYRDLMKFRKKVIREERAKGIDKDVFPPGETIDQWRKTAPKKYAALVKKMGEATREQLEHNMSTSTAYPPDTIRDWRMTVRAIERGWWHPTTPMMRAWRPPKRKTLYDNLMNS